VGSGSRLRFRPSGDCAAVERTLQVEVLVVDKEQVFAAMVALKQGRGSFADALIAELGAGAGCIHTLTFDTKLFGFRASPFYRRASKKLCK
jgi:predicted nucleic-acid-binding protein